MFRLLAVATVLMAACETPSRRFEPRDASADAADAADVSIDAPPPPPPAVDAGPPPAMACSAAEPTCELPPSTCLDSYYLVYYTDGTCVSDMCEYTTHLLYCPTGCVDGGCAGGFT